MRGLALFMLVGALAGCPPSDATFELSDAGVSCLPPASTDAGQATLTGERAFNVASAHQAPATEGSSQQMMSVELFEDPKSCGDGWYDEEVGFGGADGGGIGDMAVVTVYSPSSGPIVAGSYPIQETPLPDDGYASVELLRYLPTGAADGGAKLDFASAASGSVQLTVVQPCAVEGTFSATFEAADGGTRSLGGSFRAPYCP